MSAEFPSPNVFEQDQSLRLAGIVVDMQDVQDFINQPPLKC